MHNGRVKGMKWALPAHRFGAAVIREITLVAAVGMLRAAPVVSSEPGPGDFILAAPGQAATLWVADQDAPAVRRAAGDLAADLERVTGARPTLTADTAALRGPAVLIGVLGHSPAIDELAQAGRLDVRGLRGEWESNVIQVVDHPLPGVDRALVIAGSDRRGAIYGIYSLSEAIGVSPWYWWADVPVRHRTTLAIRAGIDREGPPSVKYRGIFLNDEDWGLHPWAAKTFDPELGDIGPKTYARIFELLLRLKGNTVWPAMHACTQAFNLYPQDKFLADEYGVVMGSSHAEPMLRDNVTEWTAPPGDYNYDTNRAGVLAYWEERVRENGRFENIYTLGMRGIHDSPMVGPKTMGERITALEQIFADQRALLARYVDPDVARVPQAFTPYKEVLDIYNAGLKVPPDATLVWPDDNFGYIRHFPTPGERARPGGSGVYYHLSYLGSPLAYLWLCTTPPALVWEEMNRAYELGARTIWIANVGDLKPAEIGTEFFLQMAWNIRRWRRDNLPGFLVEWATREFGPARAAAIASVMERYYRLNYQRKPEHLQWWLRNEPPRPSPFTAEEIRQRLDAFAELRAEVDRLAAGLPAADQDAFYELVAYPVRGSALANERYFDGELSALHAARGLPDAPDLARRAESADAQLKEATRIYNEQIAGGKWNRMLALEPADNQWRNFRIAPWHVPDFGPSTGKPGGTQSAPRLEGEAPAEPILESRSGRGSPSIAEVKAPPPPGFAGFVERDGIVSMEADHFTAKIDRGGVAWEVIPGLGRTNDCVTVFPVTAASIEPSRLEPDAPRLDYAVFLKTAGEIDARLDLLPTQPNLPGRGLRLAVALDDQPPQLLTGGTEVGSKEWAQSVLDERVTIHARLQVPAPGAHVFRVFMVDPGVLLDKIVLETKQAEGLPQGYLGPPETRTGN